MRVGATDVPVRRLVRSQCVYVTVGTTRTAMKEIVLMTTLPLYSTLGLIQLRQELVSCIQNTVAGTGFKFTFELCTLVQE